jgi:hypothetical protein
VAPFRQQPFRSQAARSTDASVGSWLGRLGGIAYLLTIGVFVARLPTADRTIIALALPCFGSVGPLRAMFVHRRRLAESID